jgi:Ca-activated chloride channel family protein
MKRCRLIPFFTVFFALCASPFTFLQIRGEASSTDSDQPLQSNAALVKIDASVIDEHGNFSSHLLGNDFRILDNGTEQPIAFFAPVEAPVQVVLMLETSPAVYLIHTEHLLGAYALAGGLKVGDQIALITYDRVPYARLALTADHSALLAALGALQYDVGSGDLNFYDSLSTAVDWLAAVPGKKAVVLLTTGLDMSPPSHWSSVVRKLQADDLVVFPIALGGSLRRYKRKKSMPHETVPRSDVESSDFSPEAAQSSMSFEKADTALRSLAETTGGRAWFPMAAQDFLPIYREIALQLRNQYILGITPAHDGQFHSLAVSVIGDPGQSSEHRGKKAKYRVFARAGYLAPDR